MTNWNQIVFVTKLLLVKDSCNMGANNTITTASSSSSGAPRRPTSFFNSKYLLLTLPCLKTYVNAFRSLDNPRNVRKDDFERGK